MPRTAVGENEIKNRVLRGSIDNAKRLKDLGMDDLSALTGIPESTLYAKIREPDKFNLRELRLICKALRIPEEEKQRLGGLIL